MIRDRFDYICTHMVMIINVYAQLNTGETMGIKQEIN